MLTFTKGDRVKYIDPNSSLIERLVADGWVTDKVEVDDEREALKEQAEALGIKVHHKAGADKIRALIEEASDNS